LDCLPRNMNGRDRPWSGIGATVEPSMSMPARMRGSASMAARAAAPPAEWPAIAIRDGSISPAPGQAGCAPVSSLRTRDTSAARPAATCLRAGVPTPLTSCTGLSARPASSPGTTGRPSALVRPRRRPTDRDGKYLSATATWYRPGTARSAEAGTSRAPARSGRHQRRRNFHAAHHHRPLSHSQIARPVRANLHEVWPAVSYAIDRAYRCRWRSRQRKTGPRSITPTSAARRFPAVRRGIAGRRCGRLRERPRAAIRDGRQVSGLLP